MKNLMIVTVKYGAGRLTMTTGRFTYDTSDGKMTDKVILAKEYGRDRYIDQAVDYLKDNGHDVVGTDDNYYGVSYIIVAPKDGTFKSISGKHEKSIGLEA